MGLNHGPWKGDGGGVADADGLQGVRRNQRQIDIANVGALPRRRCPLFADEGIIGAGRTVDWRYGHRCGQKSCWWRGVQTEGAVVGAIGADGRLSAIHRDTHTGQRHIGRFAVGCKAQFRGEHGAAHLRAGHGGKGERVEVNCPTATGQAITAHIHGIAIRVGCTVSPLMVTRTRALAGQLVWIVKEGHGLHVGGEYRAGR